MRLYQIRYKHFFLFVCFFHSIWKVRLGVLHLITILIAFNIIIISTLFCLFIQSNRIVVHLFYFYRRYYFLVFTCHSHRRLTLTIVNFSEYAKCLRPACRCRQFRQFLLGGFLAGICWFNNCRSPKTCFEPWLLLLFFVLNKKI